MPAWYAYISESAGRIENENVDANVNNNKKSARGDQPDAIDPKMAKEVPSGENSYSKKYKPKRNTIANVNPLLRDTNSMYTRYVRLKYYERRFEPRNGSIDGMPFNPYLIPGYSFSYVGEHSGSFSFTGLVTNVSHNISADGGMQTSMSYGFGRTLKENYEIAIQDALVESQLNKENGKGFDIEKFHATAPTMPTRVLSDELQHTETASGYFKNLFYQGAKNKATVFDFKKFFVSSGKVGSHFVPTSKPIPKNITDGYEVVLENTSELDAERGSYNKAMQYTSRPVCTLDEYIKFINGGVGVGFSKTDLLPASKYGVEVPTFIRKYLSEDPAGAGSDNVMEKYIKPTLEPPYPIFDLRRDWVSRIQRYRTKVHNREIQK